MWRCLRKDQPEELKEVIGLLGKMGVGEEAERLRNLLPRLAFAKLAVVEELSKLLELQLAGCSTK